jgi:hypothetical protein
VLAEELRPDMAERLGSPAVTGLLALPKELQLLIAEYVSPVKFRDHTDEADGVTDDDERRYEKSLPDLQGPARADDAVLI